MLLFPFVGACPAPQTADGRGAAPTEPDSDQPAHLLVESGRCVVGLGQKEVVRVERAADLDESVVVGEVLPHWSEKDFGPSPRLLLCEADHSRGYVLNL